MPSKRLSGRYFLILLIAIIAALTGCSPSPQQAQTVPTSTPEPAATATSTHTATLEPTAIPTAKPTEIPTQTPEPTPEPLSAEKLVQEHGEYYAGWKYEEYREGEKVFIIEKLGHYTSKVLRQDEQGNWEKLSPEERYRNHPVIVEKLSQLTKWKNERYGQPNLSPDFYGFTETSNLAGVDTGHKMLWSMEMDEDGNVLAEHFTQVGDEKPESEYGGKIYHFMAYQVVRVHREKLFTTWVVPTFTLNSEAFQEAFPGKKVPLRYSVNRESNNGFGLAILEPSDKQFETDAVARRVNQTSKPGRWVLMRVTYTQSPSVKVQLGVLASNYDFVLGWRYIKVNNLEEAHRLYIDEGEQLPDGKVLIVTEFRIADQKPIH
jgi:hypothetical protein